MTALTSAQHAECKRALDEQGYVVLPNVVAAADLAEFDAVVEREFADARARNALFEGGGMLSGHLNSYPGEAARFAYGQIRDAGIVDVVREMRPDWAESVRVTMNYNMPGSVPQHYHMDGQYTRDFLICNIAVVDTDLRNGALDVLPGTNRQFYRFWEYALQRKYRTSTRVPLRRGDVVLRRSTLWHRGMPNRSERARPMLAITFGEVHEHDPDPFGHEGGAMTFYPNWFSTSWKGKLRERTVVKVPVTYSAYRFARSLMSDKGYDH